MPASDKEHYLYLDSPLDPTVTHLASFSGEEAISRLFHFQLEIVYEPEQLPPDSILGQFVSFGLTEWDENKPRHFHGLVTALTQYTRGELGTVYRLDVHPAFWIATRTTDCRVFQDLTVVDILQKIVSEYPGLDVRYSITGTYPKRKYCVQYNESDFHFLSRLMEEEGIFYYFEFREGQHTLVFADDLGTSPAIPNAPVVEYDETSGGTRWEERINRWLKCQELRSGKVVFRDYNFGAPTNKLETKAEVAASVSAGKVTHKLAVANNKAWELFAYPGGYVKPFDAKQTGDMLADGSRVAKLRLQQEESEAVLIEGNSNVRNLTAGHRFQLSRHFNSDGAYVVVAVNHSAQESGLFAERLAERTGHYANAFTCVPADHKYRPPRVTPKPFVRGCQTARVVGPKGEEIYTDEYGRVKVQFFWDREGGYDDGSSCWVRVASAWAGQNWGAITIPRIGQEVVVAFLEGDPDQPLIIGSVYNQDNMPPYKLPDHKTRSALRSRSSKGGGPSNFNEIRFEDLKGKEQVFIHAERDLDVRVKQDWREFCGNDRHSLIKKDFIEEIQGELHQKVKGKRVEEAADALHITVGQDQHAKVGTSYALEAGTEIHIKGGMKVVVEAGMQLSLKAAGGFVDIGPAGVTIQGTLVRINSGGSAASGAGASPEKPKAPDQADDGSKGTKL